MASAIGSLGELAGMAAEAREQISHGRLQRVMALLAALAAGISGFEAWIQHTRGAFRNWWMWTPVVLTFPTVLASVAALFSRRAARYLLPWASAVLFVDGVVGFVLHLRRVRRMPGGLKLGTYNVTMGPPLFAPLLFTIVGLLGILAGFLRPEILGGRRRRR